MECPNPNFVWPKGKVIAVPCGKCLACLSNKRQDWSFRLMQEYKVSSSAFFVTLTYSDKYYPSDHGVSKRHLQLYFKRLRKKARCLRYYAVGEYGTKTGRAHYHAIIFNADEISIRACWSLQNKVLGRVEPIGLVHIGRVTESSVSYVLKYIVQKEEREDGLNKPFSLMSRGHALGGNYLTDSMVEWHRANSAVYILRYGERLRLPRFYKDKIWPNSTWSDWASRREKVLEKSRMEAEAKDELENELLRRRGIKDPVAYRSEARDMELAKIKTKVAYSQKF